jgi:hypothetical protein
MRLFVDELEQPPNAKARATHTIPKKLINFIIAPKIFIPSENTNIIVNKIITFVRMDDLTYQINK